ncbi:MAG: SpoIIE family protein phosphatase [Gemmatimonadetes bacterium]|nr:SpoIIE family protein phosphatase [Gemmatimonadota bacterium]
MSDLDAVLSAFRAATGCPASVWVQPAPHEPLQIEGGDPGDTAAPSTELRPAEGVRESLSDGALQIVARIPGARIAWLSVGPSADHGAARLGATLLLPVAAQVLRSQLEVSHAAQDLAERYEEINLLYSIGEILGRTVSLEDAAATILNEISETVGARRGAIYALDRTAGVLRPVATLGAATPLADIPVDDAASVTARVFRTHHALTVADGAMPSDAEAPIRRGALLSVPIMWATPQGGVPLGVVNLSGRRGGQPFTASDQKLVAAIATQVGTTIQNARLVRASTEQAELTREMALAHDLQMKLLPPPHVLAPDADCAARVAPAESVGGDFYNLFQLGDGRVGVLIGDVSSHGYRSALIMALVMSATAIHARGSSDPAATIGALFVSLADELRETEMFMTVCYAVIDTRAGVVTWCNAGHPHAFVVHANGDAERLAATDPPLGLADDAPHAASRGWAADDLLVLFTDGISDARSSQKKRLGEQAVLEVVKARRADPAWRIVDGVFALVEGHMGAMPPRDDQAIVVLRTVGAMA